MKSAAPVNSQMTNEDNVQAYCKQARPHEELGEYTYAELSFSHALSLDMDNPTALVGYARVSKLFKDLKSWTTEALSPSER